MGTRRISKSYRAHLVAHSRAILVETSTIFLEALATLVSPYQLCSRSGSEFTNDQGIAQAQYGISSTTYKECTVGKTNPVNPSLLILYRGETRGRRKKFLEFFLFASSLLSEARSSDPGLRKSAKNLLMSTSKVFGPLELFVYFIIMALPSSGPL